MRSPSIRSRRRRAARSGIEVPARDFGHDLAAMRAAITPDTRIVFVANPNNPTGTCIAPDALEAFIASVPRDVLVVLDEAYNEYLEPAERADTVRWIARYPHLARLALVLEGLRAGGAARRLRRRCIRRWPTCSIACASRSTSTRSRRRPRVAALADTAYVEREPRAQPRRACAARRRPRSAGRRIRAVARQLRARQGRRRARGSTTRCCARA